MGPGAYVLIDPGADTLNGDELRQMAAELQVHLFGTQGQQDLCMLTFEGDEEQVLKFTTVPEEELLAMRSGVEPPPPEDRTRLVNQDGVRELAPWGSTPRVVAEQAKIEDTAPARFGWRGVYSLPTQRFEACQIQPFVKPGEAEPQADGAFMDRDLRALDRALAALEGDPRLKAHRFLSARSQYVGRKIRIGLAGVKAPRELELASKMGAHIVKGPLISALFATPVADQALPVNELPLRT